MSSPTALMFTRGKTLGAIVDNPHVITRGEIDTLDNRLRLRRALVRYEERRRDKHRDSVQPLHLVLTRQAPSSIPISASHNTLTGTPPAPSTNFRRQFLVSLTLGLPSRQPKLCVVLRKEHLDNLAAILNSDLSDPSRNLACCTISRLKSHDPSPALLS